MTTAASLERRVRALEEKTEALEGVAAIMKLKARYAQLCDARQFAKGKKELKVIADELANLFTEDGVWDGGKRYGVCRGRKEIFGHFVQQVHKVSVHYFMTPHITIKGNKARGRWYLLCPIATPYDKALWTAAFQDDEYVKVNGQWLQRRMKMTMVFLAPYEQGWAKKRMASPEEMSWAKS